MWQNCVVDKHKLQIQYLDPIPTAVSSVSGTFFCTLLIIDVYPRCHGGELRMCKTITCTVQSLLCIIDRNILTISSETYPCLSCRANNGSFVYVVLVVSQFEVYN